MPENNVVLFYLGHISFVDNLNGFLNELTNPWEVKNWLKMFQTVITFITDQYREFLVNFVVVFLKDNYNQLLQRVIHYLIRRKS